MWDNFKSAVISILILIVIASIALSVVLLIRHLAIPARTAINDLDYSLNKVDEATNYEILKKVEDTARAYITSYVADRLTYETYSKSEIREERNYATAAKIRANNTASTYNNYMLKNSYVWGDNIPSDIDKSLPYIGIED